MKLAQDSAFFPASFSTSCVCSIASADIFNSTKKPPLILGTYVERRKHSSVLAVMQMNV